jgi:hypothetical protein
MMVIGDLKCSLHPFRIRLVTGKMREHPADKVSKEVAPGSAASRSPTSCQRGCLPASYALYALDMGIMGGLTLGSLPSSNPHVEYVATASNSSMVSDLFTLAPFFRPLILVFFTISLHLNIGLSGAAGGQSI